MATPPASKPAALWSWRLSHVLAISPPVLLGCFVYMAIAFRDSGHFPPLTPLFANLCRFGVLGTFWLWGWMLWDHFYVQSGPRSRIWSIALVVLNWGAAYVYFFKVWRPSHSHAGV